MVGPLTEKEVHKSIYVSIKFKHISNSCRKRYNSVYIFTEINKYLTIPPGQRNECKAQLFETNVLQNQGPYSKKVYGQRGQCIRKSPLKSSKLRGYKK